MAVAAVDRASREGEAATPFPGVIVERALMGASRRAHARASGSTCGTARRDVDPHDFVLCLRAAQAPRALVCSRLIAAGQVTAAFRTIPCFGTARPAIAAIDDRTSAGEDATSSAAATIRILP